MFNVCKGRQVENSVISLPSVGELKLVRALIGEIIVLRFGSEISSNII